MPIVGQFGSLAGLGSLVLPGGAMESIATVTVGSGGASSITFSDIPGGFQHLQLRVLGRTSRTGANGDYVRVRFNSDTGSNYAYHLLYGTGASAVASGFASQTFIGVDRLGDASNTDYWGAIVIDILDYANTSKNKTLRSLGGNDRNGAGSVDVDSGVWLSTNAITAVELSPDASRTFAQHSTAALYGLRAP